PRVGLAEFRFGSHVTVGGNHHDSGGGFEAHGMTTPFGQAVMLGGCPLCCKWRNAIRGRGNNKKSERTGSRRDPAARQLPYRPATDEPKQVMRNRREWVRGGRLMFVVKATF